MVQRNYNMHVYELSEYQIYQLKSIDPALSTNWKTIIANILPQLDPASRKSVYEKILSKRNISANFTYIIPENLRSVLSNTAVRNKELQAISVQMLKLVESQPQTCDAIDLADKVEAMIDYINRIDIGDHHLDQQSRKSIKRAFLYDLATWIDNVNLIVQPGIRQLNVDVVKTYFKEVFIKQKIQERDFRAWDSTDIDFQEQENLPSIIREEAKRKKFFVIESEKYWYLIGIADKPRQNPYSFKRFLHEDSMQNELYVYLTHVVLRKNLLDNERYLEHVTYCMSRLYTLDAGVSDTIIKFIEDAQYKCKTQIEPLLKKPLEKDGEETEFHIHKRMNEYEQQITVLILNKLNNLIENAISDKDDRDYLFYYLSKIFNRMIDSIQNFQLLPIATYSYNVEIMVARLISFRHLLDMIYDSLENKNYNAKGLTEASKEIIDIIKEEFDDVESKLKQISRLEQKLKLYHETKEKGNLWQRLIVGWQPRYDFEDIEHSKNQLKNEFFLSIVRLAKSHTDNIIYLEFDCDETVNEYYRHYAIANDKMVITRLPKVLRLPEDKETFDVQKINEAIHHNVFIFRKSSVL